MDEQNFDVESGARPAVRFSWHALQNLDQCAGKLLCLFSESKLQNGELRFLRQGREHTGECPARAKEGGMPKRQRIVMSRDSHRPDQEPFQRMKVQRSSY